MSPDLRRGRGVGSMKGAGHVPALCAIVLALAACERQHRVIEAPPREIAPPHPTGLARIGPCPEGAVLIAEGTFDRDGAKISVAPFCLDRTEVTVAAYAECVSAEGCRRAHAEPRFDGATARDLAYLASHCNEGRRGRETHPVNCIEHAQAEAYCRHVGGRLPTADEWEWAARGRDEARRFPWGADAPSAEHLNACDAACKEAFADVGREHKTMFDTSDGFAGTAPVGTYPKGASRDGLLDMAGNVFEWTSTPIGDAAFADRGGGWSNAGEATVEVAHPHAFDKASRDGSLGVRCAHAVGR